jgi:hypothetical protein
MSLLRKSYGRHGDLVNRYGIIIICDTDIPVIIMVALRTILYLNNGLGHQISLIELLLYK